MTERKALELRNLALAQRNATLARELFELQEGLAAARSEQSRLHATLDAVYASTSWRITAPLRVLMRGLTATRRARRAESSPGEPEAVPSGRSAAYRELLVQALFQPRIQLPYGPEHRYFIAFMDGYGKHLAERYRDRPPSTLVSIVMTTGDRAGRVGDAIRSVVAQTYPNWQLIVADGGGSDDTARLVSSFEDSRIEYLRIDLRHGAAGARNAALDLVAGELIGYLDGDESMQPDHLLILANELAESPDLDMVYCGRRVFSGAGDAARELYVELAPFHRPSLENLSYIDLGTLLHRRTLLESVGRFDTERPSLADWGYVLALTAHGTAKAVPVITSHGYRDGPTGRVTDAHPLDEGESPDAVGRRANRVSQAIAGLSLPGAEQMVSLPYETPEPVVRRPVSIVVPSYEAGPYLQACIEAVHGFADGHELELIVVDNASGAAVVTYLRELQEQGRGRVLLNEANLGFTFAVNQGIEAARPGNDVIILTNDAIVTRGWLSALQAVISDYPDVGLVAPSQIVPAGEPSLTIHQPHRLASRECDVNLSAHHRNLVDPLFDVPKGYMELSFAPFFCIYVPRDTLELVGRLDVENGPHYRSDRLYCDMVREIGRRRILYTPHAKVYHFVQRATKDLEANDAKLFDDMFLNNDWRAIAERRSSRD